MVSSHQHGAMLLSFLKLGKSALETFEIIKQTYGNAAQEFLSGTKYLRKSRSLSKTTRTDATSHCDCCAAAAGEIWPRPGVFLFLQIKRELKGHWFDSIEAVQTVTTKALNSILETDFQRACDEWQMSQSKCIDAGGMYFEDY